MKKVISVVCAALLLGALLLPMASAAEVVPTVAVSSNLSAPAKSGDEVELYLYLTGFSAVKGVRLELTLDRNIDFVALENTDENGVELVEGTNYQFDEVSRMLRIVDLFGSATDAATLALTVKAVGDDTAAEYEIKVNGEAVDDTKKPIALTFSDGALVIGKIEAGSVAAPVAGQELPVEAPEGFFVPYGGVYTASGEFAPRDENGNFVPKTDDPLTVQYFKLPADGKKLTTFGASKKLDDTTLQFGTYVTERVDGAEYGTLLIESADYDKYMNYYRAKGYTDGQIVAMIMKAYQSKKTPETTHVNFSCTVGGKKVSISVYNVSQTKFMWKNTDDTTFQFALRVKGISTTNTYAAVAWSFFEEEYSFSTEIKKTVFDDFK